jgi:hypothetical protein
MSEAKVNTDSRNAFFACPLCGQKLPRGAKECTKCDWVLGYRHRKPITSGTPRDFIAAALSIIPGTGHIFKGHAGVGIAYMVGTLVAVFFIGAVWMVSMGFQLLVLPFYWIWVAIHAYFTPDLKSVDHVPERIG